MNPGEVGEVVSVLQPNTLLLSPELLHVRSGNLSIEVLHKIGPASIELITGLANELIVLGCLRHAEDLGLILYVFPDWGYSTVRDG